MWPGDTLAERPPRKGKPWRTCLPLPLPLPLPLLLASPGHGEKHADQRHRGCSSMTRTVTIAAVQPALQLGAVEANLSRLENLIRDAHREHHADVVIAPEAGTSPNVYSRSLRDVARPVAAFRSSSTPASPVSSAASSAGDF